MQAVKIICGVAALCAAFTAHAADPLLDQGEIVYTIQAGDNLNTLSARFLDHVTRWNDVARRNKMPNAHLLRIGQKLFIPYAWLKNEPAQAHFTAVSGDVRLENRPAKVGDTFSSGAQIITGAGGAAQLKLPDGSVIAVLENTLLQATHIEQKPKGVFYNSRFYLDQGRIDAVKVKYADGQAPLSIQGKHATIGIRGTHFRAGQIGSHTLAEIENGLVHFSDEKTAPHAKAAPPLALEGRQGALADGVNDATAVELLPPPDFSTLPASLPPNAAHITLPTVTGATGFRGELALDAQFTQILTFVQSDSHHIVFSGLADGNYYLRLRAVDVQGLQGQENITQLTIKTPPYIPPPVFIPRIDSGDVRLHWNGGVQQ